MNGWMSKIAGGSLVLPLPVAIFLGGYSSLLSHRLELARQQTEEQQKTLAQQAGLIAMLQMQDAQNRADGGPATTRAAAASAGRKLPEEIS